MGKPDIRLFLQFLITLVKYFDLKLWKAVRYLAFYKRWAVQKLIWKRGQLFRPAIHLGIALLALLAIVGGAVFGPLPSLATKSQAILPPAIAPQNTIKTEVPQNRPRSATIEHIVSGGETLSELATKYNVSVDTIKWANNLSSDDISPGQKLLVPPVTGVVHIAAKGETLSSIADAHGVTTDAMINFPFNDIPDDKTITEGQIIVVPGGKPVDVVHPPAPKPAVAAAHTSSPAPVVYSNLGNGYPFGQCTYYVASRRHIPWLDNAGGWYRDAISAGFRVGHTPAPGAIQVSYEGSSLGHVALVESVNSDGSYTVSEMNYYGAHGGGWGRVDHRMIVPGTVYVVGFIY